MLASNGYVFDAPFMDETGTECLGTCSELSQMLTGDMKSVRSAVAFNESIEVQVHGGISIDDIDRLVVDVPQDRSQRTTKDQIAEGAYADAWKAKYEARARVSWG